MNKQLAQLYSIQNIIGNGAYSHVELAIRKSDGQKVAIKTMSKAAIIRSKRTKTAENEIEAYSKCDNPNIIKLYDTFQDSLTISLILEYAENGNFTKYLSTNPSVYNVQHILAQVLLSISYLHRKGIIHRDLKPDNILLDSQYRVKLCDLGSVKIIDKENFVGYQTGSFVGSPDFISPEIIENEPTTPAVDLWGFGVLIYYAFSQNYPFSAPTNFATYSNISSIHYSMSEKIPLQAQDLIHRLLVRDASSRIGFGEEDSNYKSIREHPFFSSIQWETISTDPLPP